jgi:deoxycytidine triphosphate deaminase
MCVLSDKAIREGMKGREFILDGNATFASGCSYEFKAGRVVYGGTDSSSQQVSSVDLTRDASQTALIRPTAVAWVKSRERVKIPANFVGLWVQTNSLSRSGLLLLNSTLVEPGYEGHLSAHFVNLGSSPVLLSAATTIAKLVFLKLDTNAADLLDSKPFQNYDLLIDGLAAKSDKSFLRIGELTPDLQRTVSALVVDAQKQIKDQTDRSVTDASNRLLTFEQKTYWRVGAGFAAGLILAMSFLVFAYPKVRDADNESKNRIAEIVREQNSRIVERLDKLQTDLAEEKVQREKGTQFTPAPAK